VIPDRASFTFDIRSASQELCRKLGLSYRIMTSGAGHDSQNMAQVYPTNVIFVPSEDGVSHDEREFTKPEDLQAGLTILSAYLKKLCWE
jgi:acetylornithine deacetylase/succinyl-diaminopimelate desuccinylase-like protein